MKIGCDICNTIADVMSEISKKFSVPLDQLYLKYDCHKYFDIPISFFKSNEGLKLFERCLPFEGAAEALGKLSQEHQVYYITSRPIEAAYVTYTWLKEYGFPRGPIIYCQDKLLITKTLKIDVMIEDAPHVIKRLIENGQSVIIKNYGYNRQYRKIVTGFPEWNVFAESLITNNSVEGIKCQRVMIKA